MANNTCEKVETGVEKQRLAEADENKISWKKWGPYLSERQWGTVREDYSLDGSAWDYFTHDQARSRAYRWGEDGLAGISDEKQRLCFALALWNGKDPIIKERLFGLTNSEGNHSEDVKEYYFYLDSTPTHSYMKYLYKYPQDAFPYDDIVRTNKSRSRKEMEYELLDTGVFDDNRYFDVFVEYAKGGPDDILIKITAINRGPEEAELHILPTLWFRNEWTNVEPAMPVKPVINKITGPDGIKTVAATHPELGTYYMYCEGNAELLFTENETNMERIFGKHNTSPYVKDGINNYMVHGLDEAVNPDGTGTKVASHYYLKINAGQQGVVCLRITNKAESSPFDDFSKVLAARLEEADDFYRSITPPSATEDVANVMRQALAGMLWSKQFYYLDANQWLKEHSAHPFYKGSHDYRNREWFHMVNADIISMPDKWEYPWYAAWDLAFHTLPLAMVDPEFAKRQMELMFDSFYLNPSGQIPAYEWNFSDVNPPVHAWAALFLFRTNKAAGKPDYAFLQAAFNKLLLNFTWWVNRKDRFGKNVFEGGFLGLDNIGVFDRSAPLPTGGYIEQADGTAWMGFFSQCMAEISQELTAKDPIYEDMITKFLEHFLYIAAAMNQPGPDGMWDDEDGFYYDMLRLPDGSSKRLKVRSIVGLLPLCASMLVESHQRDMAPRAAAAMLARLRQMPELLKTVHETGPENRGIANRSLIAMINNARLRRILTKMLDENEFLSPYGIRSISKYHERNPYIFKVKGKEYRVDYLPAESDSGMFGGNSNWRGPIWMPVNVMIITALLRYYLYYGDNFKIECPTGSGKMMNLFEVAKELSDRLTNIFLRDANGRRPVYGGTEKFQTDPNWRDNILFYEYFHGDNGAGIGASHQTGWTGLVAKLIQFFGVLDPEELLAVGRSATFSKIRD